MKALITVIVMAIAQTAMEVLVVDVLKATTALAYNATTSMNAEMIFSTTVTKTHPVRTFLQITRARVTKELDL